MSVTSAPSEGLAGERSGSCPRESNPAAHQPLFEGHDHARRPAFPILLFTNPAASRGCYHDTLGLELIAEDHERIVLRCGGGTQLVIWRSTVGTSDTQTQMAWRVADIRPAIADPRGRGVHIEEYQAPEPVTVDGVADMGYSWAAWFIDLHRNVLALVQPKG